MENASEQTSAAPRWQPLDRVDRRVLGVLIEKGKTTPDNYPISLNALRTGCNQKSNRFPLMELDDDHVEESIERLRLLGAVAVIQGDSRVDKYRHLAYEWLQVDKVEIAVMAELILRGAQTLGELRGRAVRMEKGRIKDLSELRPIVDRLVEKKLVVYLTPEGRGAVVTHTLYTPSEFEKVCREHSGDGSPAAPSIQPAEYSRAEAGLTTPHQSRVPDANKPPETGESAEIAQLQTQLASLRDELNQVREEATAAIADVRQMLQKLRQELGNP